MRTRNVASLRGRPRCSAFIFMDAVVNKYRNALCSGQGTDSYSTASEEFCEIVVLGLSVTCMECIIHDLIVLFSVYSIL